MAARRHRAPHPQLADHIVTTAPDVTVSTNLGGWVNSARSSMRTTRSDRSRTTASPRRRSWTMSPQGQHIELGIAEAICSCCWRRSVFPRRCSVSAAADRHGLRSVHQSRSRCAELRVLSGRAVHPGRDAFGRSLAPEGGAHSRCTHRSSAWGSQGSRPTSLRMWMNSPRFSAGASSICRPKTAAPSIFACRRGRSRSAARSLTTELRRDILEGGYWLGTRRSRARDCGVRAGRRRRLEAHQQLRRHPGSGSARRDVTDRLERGWSHAACAVQAGRRGPSHIEHC